MLFTLKVAKSDSKIILSLPLSRFRLNPWYNLYELLIRQKLDKLCSFPSINFRAKNSFTSHVMQHLLRGPFFTNSNQGVVHKWHHALFDPPPLDKRLIFCGHKESRIIYGDPEVTQTRWLSQMFTISYMLFRLSKLIAFQDVQWHVAN